MCGTEIVTFNVGAFLIFAAGKNREAWALSFCVDYFLRAIQMSVIENPYAPPQADSTPTRVLRGRSAQAGADGAAVPGPLFLLLALQTVGLLSAVDRRKGVAAGPSILRDIFHLFAGDEDPGQAGARRCVLPLAAAKSCPGDDLLRALAVYLHLVRRALDLIHVGHLPGDRARIPGPAGAGRSEPDRG